MSKSTSRRYVSAFNLLPKSFSLIKDNLGLFALINSVSVIMPILSSFRASDGVDFSATSTTTNFSAIYGVTAGAAVVIIVLRLVLQVMAIRLQLDVAEGNRPSVSRLWEFCRQYFFKYIGLSIVMGLAIGLGIILLIVPGIILISRFFFAPLVMADENLGIIDSLKRSTELSKGNWGAIWSVIGVVILIYIFSLLLVGIGLGVVGTIVSLLLGVAYSVAPALRYFEVKKASHVND